MNRKDTEEEKLNQSLLSEIRRLHQEKKGIYGYRRMRMVLNRKFNRIFNHKRIYRLMRLEGIQSIIRKKRKRYQKNIPNHVAENVLNRQFEADRPNEKWVTDVTEFKYGTSSKAYLSAIRDLFDGSIVAYVLGRSNNNTLVFETLEKALKAEPGAKPILHSERGFQYTSVHFKEMTEQAGITTSMSRVGRCIDNSPIESFWSALKCEKYYLDTYETFEELEEAISEYILFYNNERLQERLSGLSPLEFRAKAA